MRPAVGIMLLRSLALAGGAHKAILLALLPVVQVVKKDLLAGLDVPISVQPDVVVAPHLIQGEINGMGQWAAWSAFSHLRGSMRTAMMRETAFALSEWLAKRERLPLGPASTTYLG